MTAQRGDIVAEDWGAPRSRVVTWHDPGPSTARGLTMAGLDYLRAMIDGTLPPPPICQLMRYDIEAAQEHGVLVAEGVVEAAAAQPGGVTEIIE
jgi:hypothetical protein